LKQGLKIDGASVYHIRWVSLWYRRAKVEICKNQNSNLKIIHDISL